MHAFSSDRRRDLVAPTSSVTSPGSSRATMMSLMPAASSAAASTGPTGAPFLSNWRHRGGRLSPIEQQKARRPVNSPPPRLVRFKRRPEVARIGTCQQVRAVGCMQAREPHRADFAHKTRREFQQMRK